MALFRDLTRLALMTLGEHGVGPAQRAADAMRRKDLTRFLQNSGLAVTPLADELPGFRGQAQAMRAAWNAQDFALYERSYLDAYRAQAVLGNALVAHRMIANAFLAEATEETRDWLDAVRIAPYVEAAKRYAQERRTPFAFALYANMLHSQGAAYRGTEFADKVTLEGWAQLAQCETLAKEALAAAGPDAAKDPLWRFTSYVLEEVNMSARFEEAWALDPYNLNLCAHRANMLLTRWHGTHEGAFDEFALRAAARTADRFGEGMYALIHQSVTDVGHLDHKETRCDLARVKRGFADLMARYPAQSVVNRYANFLIWTRRESDEIEAWELVASRRLKAIVPEVWLGDVMVEKVEDALEDLMFSKETWEDAQED
jgi:hypothetical protein